MPKFQCTACALVMTTDRKPRRCWQCEGRVQVWAEEPPALLHHYKCAVCGWEYQPAYTADAVMCFGDAVGKHHTPAAMELLGTLRMDEQVTP